MLKYTNLFIDADGHKHQHTIETNQIPTDILIQMTAEIMGLMPNQMDDDDEEDEYRASGIGSSESMVESKGEAVRDSFLSFFLITTTVLAAVVIIRCAIGFFDNDNDKSF